MSRSSTQTPRRCPAATALMATALAVLTSSVAAGCGSSGGSSDSSTSSASSSSASSPALSGSITVFAAASLTGTFTTLAQQFQAAHPGTTVTPSFGSSSTLAQQIVAGAPADVFASAATKDMQTVTGAGDAGSSQVFATNSAEIAVAPGDTKVTSVDDLAAPGVTVALCQPQVPCGALAQMVLSNAGVSVTPVTQGLDVKSTLAYVTSGQVDAAVVYVTDVKAAGSAVTGVTIPAKDNAVTQYPIAVVKASRNPDLAQAFQAYVLSSKGQAVLAAAGFAKP